MERSGSEGESEGEADKVDELFHIGPISVPKPEFLDSEEVTTVIEGYRSVNRATDHAVGLKAYQVISGVVSLVVIIFCTLLCCVCCLCIALIFAILLFIVVVIAFVDPYQYQ